MATFHHFITLTSLLFVIVLYSNNNNDPYQHMRAHYIGTFTDFHLLALKNKFSTSP